MHASTIIGIVLWIVESGVSLFSAICIYDDIFVYLDWASAFIYDILNTLPWD